MYHLFGSLRSTRFIRLKSSSPTTHFTTKALAMLLLKVHNRAVYAIFCAKVGNQLCGIERSI